MFTSKTVSIATLRTVFQSLIGFLVTGAIALIALQESGYLDDFKEVLPPGVFGYVSALAVFLVALSGLVTRIMYLPAVEVFVAKYAPFLSYFDKRGGGKEDEPEEETDPSNP